jgi:hypothetical protein
MMMKKILLLAVVICASSAVSAQTVQLIKDDEAKLPAGVGAIATRAITRGPGVKLVTPEAVPGKSFPLKVAFEPRGGAQVDLASVKVEYLKTPVVDLTERVKSGIKADGIDLSSVNVPAGAHPIRISLRDSEGRQGMSVFNLTAH